ncbi:uncharacterized protein [Dermacentor albipictus]|uniref:uncharacterized protein isoform X4 n=1 Tax=Dermacentor albipictus TaxID=60249 RepID=UPI0038FD319E
MLHHESLPRPMPLKYAVRFWMSGAISIVFYIANLVVDVQETCAWHHFHCRKRQNAFSGRPANDVCIARSTEDAPECLLVNTLVPEECELFCMWCPGGISQHPAMMVFPQRCTACVPNTKSTSKQRVHGIRSTEGSAKMLSVGDVQKTCASPGAERMCQTVS